MNIFCRFCVSAVLNDDAELVKVIPKDILAALLIEPNLEENWDSVICRDCYKRLLAVFEFKSTCMRSDAAILSYIDKQTPSEVDLRDIYLRGVDKHTVTLSEDEKVCRLCMELAGKQFLSLQELDFERLQNLFPEIQLNIIKDPVVCKSCFDSFTTHSNFLIDCLDIFTKDSGLLESVFYRNKPLQSFIKTEEIDIKHYDEPELNNKEIDEKLDTCFEVEDIKKEIENTSGEVLTGIKQTNPSGCKAQFTVCPQEYHMNQKYSSGKKMYKFNVCNNESKIKENFKMHQLMHKDTFQVQMYRCCTCSYKTLVKGRLKKHQLIHKDPSQVQMYKCDTCDYKTRVKGSLKTHQLIHKDPSQVRMYICDICDYKTKYRNNLKEHQLRHKDPCQVQMYKCHTCNFETKIKSRLQRHQLVHKDPSQVQMYKCDTCNYKTRIKDSLNRHHLLHKDPSQVQMYKCVTCDYKTKFRNYIKKHLLKHKDLSQVQMYKCDICGHQTKTKYGLKRHLLIHKDSSQVQMYKCDTCDLQTRYKENLKKHQLKCEGPSKVQKYKRYT